MAEALPPGTILLGFDSSTQSLKVTAVDNHLRVTASQTVHYDSELPHYGTKGGVRRAAHDPTRITAPPLMWAEALELALTKLQRADFPFGRVRAVSGSGQQHGSVYWRQGAEAALSRLDSTAPLTPQLRDCFATDESPVWMDASTAAECREIEAAVGGPSELVALTGSRAYERFPGPQIRKLHKSRPDVYTATERISLVSSFAASLLIGRYAPIDHSDGAGMNLMDLHTRQWAPAALEATAPGLEAKLGPLSVPHAVAGPLHTYFVERFGFSSDCQVITWSGDNPCSFAGLALERPGDLAISLGTSDTIFGVVAEPRPGLLGHVFPNPVDPHSYMLMLCYKNGSLVREAVRDRCAAGSWEEFGRLLRSTPPLNGGKVGFYYSDPEILPPLPAGEHRFVFRDGSDKEAEPLAHFDAASEVRALLEGQIVSMRAHAERAGMKSPPERVIATGGGSANEDILALAAAIFGCSVYTAERPDSASLGAALRAGHGLVCHLASNFVSFTDFLRLSRAEDSGNAVDLKQAKTAGPPDLQLQYGVLAKQRIKLEEKLLTCS